MDPITAIILIGAVVYWLGGRAEDMIGAARGTTGPRQERWNKRREDRKSRPTKAKSAAGRWLEQTGGQALDRSLERSKRRHGRKMAWLDENGGRLSERQLNRKRRNAARADAAREKLAAGRQATIGGVRTAAGAAATAARGALPGLRERRAERDAWGRNATEPGLHDDIAPADADQPNAQYPNPVPADEHGHSPDDPDTGGRCYGCGAEDGQLCATDCAVAKYWDAEELPSGLRLYDQDWTHPPRYALFNVTRDPDEIAKARAAGLPVDQDGEWAEIDLGKSMADPAPESGVLPRKELERWLSDEYGRPVTFDADLGAGADVHVDDRIPHTNNGHQAENGDNTMNNTAPMAIDMSTVEGARQGLMQFEHLSAQWATESEYLAQRSQNTADTAAQVTAILDGSLGQLTALGVGGELTAGLHAALDQYSSAAQRMQEAVRLHNELMETGQAVAAATQRAMAALGKHEAVADQASALQGGAARNMSFYDGRQ